MSGAEAMADYTFSGGDMGDPTKYSPPNLPGADDTVTIVANAPNSTLGTSLTIGVLNNTSIIVVQAGGSLTVTTYNDTGGTAIDDGGTLTVKGNYTANNVAVGGDGQLIVNGTLTVSNGGTIG